MIGEHSDGIELDRLRLRGMEILAVAGLISTVALMAMGLALHAETTHFVVIVSALANIAPTFMAVRRRHDDAARLVLGTLAAIQPALGVYLLAGHPWQMDGHMYFFVAMAGLTVLCDWKPIALATVLVAVHHLLLEDAAPEWVFTGAGNLDRVLIHALAVGLQCAVLSYVTVKLRGLLVRQAEGARESERLAAEAIARNRETETAMAAARAAEARESIERGRRETLEAAAADRRRADMHTLANAFHASVSEIVHAVGAASNELEGSAHALNDLARRASRGTSDTALVATRSSDTAQLLAARIKDLTGSIGAIASTVDQQASLSGDAASISDSGHQAVIALAQRSSAIAGFADSISDIAGRTNLLALNAAMEAARVGDAGRGFAVVAQEVKQLAGQASGATDEIRTLAGSVMGGADIANGALREIASTVGALALSAKAIRAAVDEQRGTARLIEATAYDTAMGATQMVQQISDVAAVVNNTETLSARVSSAATILSRTAQDLQQATERFVAQLKAA
jgi:methyl-accepting chemotaxis protein